ncbi:MAG: hypothetical protein GY913_30675 [Proteobacteria bacterium]|nr:hypothetical protein [Pseudomonadota bacterium]MCP4921282.1 hypothetical protein [Pseudomonadota bacterium]
MQAVVPTASPSALANYIVGTHHALLREELPRIATALRETGQAELYDAWLELAGFLSQHLAKEEEILFPMIEELERSGYSACLAGAMSQMNYEHVAMSSLEERVRQLSMRSSLRTRITALLDDLAVHACLEDDELFPLVRELAGFDGT